MKNLRELIKSYKSKYTALPLKSKNTFKLVVIAILIIVLPLFIYAVTQINTELRKRASSGEPGECLPVAGRIEVSPTSEPGAGCYDIQRAIDNSPSGQHTTIFLKAGTYNVFDTGQDFSIKITGKSDISIVGENDGIGTRLATVEFPNNSGGFQIKDSEKIALNWFNIEGSTANGILRAEDSSFVQLSHLGITDTGANAVQLRHLGYYSYLLNSVITVSESDGVQVSSSDRFDFSGNKVVSSGESGVVFSNSSGNINFNLFESNRESGIKVDGTTGVKILNNTVVNNNPNRGVNSAGIFITFRDIYNNSANFVEATKNIVTGNGVGIRIKDATIQNTGPNNYTLTLSSNDVYQNTPTNYAGDVTDPGTKYGNISASPLFGTDYCLGAGSPAILNLTGPQYMGHHGPCGANVYPHGVCWNRVSEFEGQLNWPTGCGGAPTGPDQFCSEALVPLNGDEIIGYSSWVIAGKPAIPECGYAPTEEPSPTLTASPTPSPTPTDSPSESPTPIESPTASPTETPVSETMRFQVSFAGVNDNRADGAKISVRFRKGSYESTTSPFSVSYIGGNVYEGAITLSTPVPPGDGYTFYVKGEKHVAQKFCQQIDQKDHCTGTGNINVFNGTFLYGFQGLSLQPGDLPNPTQDGVADSKDFAKIQSLLGKTCSSLTNEEKYIADLDYSGCVNTKDMFLFRKTLETRYDDN